VVSDANSTAREVNTVKQPFTRLRPATLCCSVATALKALSSHSCSGQHTQPSPVRPLTSVPEFTRLSMSSHRFQNLLAFLVPSRICSGIYSPLWCSSHIWSGTYSALECSSSTSHVCSTHQAAPSRICFRHYSLFSCPEITPVSSVRLPTSVLEITGS